MDFCENVLKADYDSDWSDSNYANVIIRGDSHEFSRKVF